MTDSLVLIAHNIRSTHNVGSLMRTAEGLGLTHLYLTGYTPHPAVPDDKRLPHVAARQSKQINKTALGAENTLGWSYDSDVCQVLEKLKTEEGYMLAGLEQTAGSQPLPTFKAPKKLAILLGSEVDGIGQTLLTKMDLYLEIPMQGKKESFNVVEAATMAMYHCRLN